MGYYAEQIFPRLMDWMLRHPRIRDLRRQLLTPVYGHVLEIGFGTGLNLPYYPATVRALCAVDPADWLPKTISARIACAPFPVDVQHVSAEALPYEDRSFDCVVSTWTLCTIPDPVAVLDEVKRVLKPGGQLIFLEHGASEDPRVRAWQARLNPIQRRLACGCHLDRPIEELIRKAPFMITHLDRFYLRGVPRVFGAMYRGLAIPLSPLRCQPPSRPSDS
jgi:SAM-dependent methyltransferase